MIFPSILITLLLQIFAPEKVASNLVDPIQLVCTLVNPLSLFTKFDSKKVNFLLWTEQNSENDKFYKLEPFNSTSLENSNFDGTKKTYVFFHGYTDVGTKQWILDAKTELLKLGPANIFSVDFGELVKEVTKLDYVGAVCNAYKVGNFTAHVFNWLSTKGLDKSLLNLIGHSLGAQICGVMGYYMIQLPIGKVPKITGLDPAGPLFYPSLLNDFKLKKGEADLVVVIHTNGCFLPEIKCKGTGEILGDIDFFPNGGTEQPGCSDVSCNHQRVTALLVESIDPNNLPFKSWPCENWETYKAGKCPESNGNYINMSIHLQTDLRGKYFLTTNKESPYAKGDNQL